MRRARSAPIASRWPGWSRASSWSDELQDATIALVSQKHGGEEFNIPSKLMNFMMYGLPVVASVDPRSEVARIVEDVRGRLGRRQRRSDGVRPRAA